MKRTEKRCTKCKRRLPPTAFHRNKKCADGHSSRCKECRNAWHREFRARPEIKVQLREYNARPENKTRRREYDAQPKAKARRRELDARPEARAQQRGYHAQPEIKARELKCRQEQRLAAFNRIGGARCVLCGKTELIFLSIDHADKNGNVHRRQFPRDGINRWILKATDTELRKWNLRVLCYDCNNTTRYASDEEVQNNTLRAVKQMIRHFKTIERK